MHRWGVVADTGQVIYMYCMVCKLRRFKLAPIAREIVDMQWVRTGKWSK